MDSSIERNQSGGFLFGGLGAVPFGIGLLAVGLLMALWHDEREGILLRLSALLLLAISGGVSGIIRRRKRGE